MSYYRDINLGMCGTQREINVRVDRSSPDIKISLQSGGGGGGNICKMLVKTTEEWESKPTFIPGKHDLIVYSDYYHNEDGSVTSRIKIGDGSAYVVDLPWIDGNISAQVDDVIRKVDEHIANTAAHITQEERIFWNEKLNYDISEGTETLVLNRN